MLASEFQPTCVILLDLDCQDDSVVLDALTAEDRQRAFVVGLRGGRPVASAFVTREQLMCGTGSVVAAVMSGEEIGVHAQIAPVVPVAERERISIVLCTRDKPVGLRACLESVSHLDYPNFDVVVVDNAPTTNASREVVEDMCATLAVRYVREERPGLSFARNTGVATTTSRIIGFVDDDTLITPDWLTHVEAAFVDPRVGGVSGLVLPGRIDTKAQERYELLGGHSKGRGFRRWVFHASGDQHPMYPLPPFGVGCNMALRREALVAAGGFDVGLGAGSLALAGEDTAAFSEILLAGYTLVYEPAAIIWHIHRQNEHELEYQRRAYGVGLGAYYASLLRKEPRRLLALVRLAPKALRGLIAARGGQTGDDVPSMVDVKAIPVGLPAYIRARRRAVKIARAHARDGERH
jgi:glycosyltransferase involved in cell wall biosynthesis